MLQITGEEHFSQSPDEVWAGLSNPEFLANSLPGLERTKQDDAGVLHCRVRPGLSFLRGSLNTTIEYLDQQPPTSLRIRIKSKGIGSSATVETTAELAAEGTGTRMTWAADVIELGGLLKPVGRSLVEAAARKVINDGWREFRNRLP